MEENKLIAGSIEDMQKTAGKILTFFHNSRIFAISGKMGVGKTTLIQAFCNVLNVTDIVNSPTFALVNEYNTNTGKSIFHFDFYRINNIEEVYDIGFEEYIYSKAYCFIEWPEIIMELLPDSFVYISIVENETHERIITFDNKHNK